MSPEERHALCKILRTMEPWPCKQAAAELERLAALAQSAAEPDGLRTQFEEWSFARGYRNFTRSGGGYLLPDIQKDWLAFKAGAIVLPRPDASAGLIEAAEWLEANNALWGALSVAKWLRARAADRSGE